MQDSTADRLAWGSSCLRDELVDYCGERGVPRGGGALAFGAATARDEALQKRPHYLGVPVVVQGGLDMFER